MNTFNHAKAFVTFCRPALEVLLGVNDGHTEEAREAIFRVMVGNLAATLTNATSINDVNFVFEKTSRGDYGFTIKVSTDYPKQLDTYSFHIKKKNGFLEIHNESANVITETKGVAK